MTEIAPRRQILDATPTEVLTRLPRMGRVMVICQSGPITHERIGPVESVTLDGGTAVVAGAAHDARIDLPAVAVMRIEVSPGPGGKVFPRISFEDAAGEGLFSVVSMDGLEPFDAGLDGLPRHDATDEARAFDMAKRPEATPEDPAHGPLAATLGQTVTLRVETPHFSQQWTGTTPELRLSMGFINVMVPDFHMHLACGAISGWAEDGATLRALDQDGAPVGLSLARVQGG